LRIAFHQASETTTSSRPKESDSADGTAARLPLYDVVLEQVGQDIVSGRLPAGSVVRADALGARFGVSRTVTREVVRVLESIHLVEARQRVGLTVLPSAEWSPFSPLVIRWRLAGPDRIEQLESLSELRAGIEPHAARLAAERATPEQCGLLTQAVIGMATTAKSGDLEAYLHHDIVFHTTLLAASRNEMYAGLSDLVAEVLTGRTRHHLMPATPEAQAIRLHGDVAAAVQNGDGQAAAEGLHAIISEANEAIHAISEVAPALTDQR
jgi:DNA-binding FadR family transcriptional regulator